MADDSGNTDWLRDLLGEVGLEQFHHKLTNDLQLTKLSHFEFVTEDDLLQLGMSRPAAKRLLAAIKKRKSFINAVKNRIFSKFMPLSCSSNPSGSGSSTSAPKNKQNDLFYNHSKAQGHQKGSDEFNGVRLTCLINSDDIQIKEEIGHGVHGLVKKGEWTAPNGRVVEVALKILRKDVVSEPGASFNDFVKEISVMHQLNHPNIIKLFGIVLSSPMMMVTELAPFGNLRDRLRQENGKTPISQLINFGVQIASGMEYLESKRFVHRDLAARNIFISHGRKILIGDLGLMRAIPNEEDHYLMSERTKIPYPWCAPESLKFKQFSSFSDVYMFGVTLWEMFSFGREPWAKLGLNEILENISTETIRLPRPEACPTMVYQTLLQCWNVIPSARPKFSTLYQYLSTSYPLEVRVSQYISEMNQKRVNGNLIPNDLTESTFPVSNTDEEPIQQRIVLECNIDDRILVIEGQPEKYWWKGQNQRTFDIGWFPLSSTRWLAPKRMNNHIPKLLYNNIASHNSPGGFLDRKIREADFAREFKIRHPMGLIPKNKTKAKLSKLFGINEPSQASSVNISNHAYQRFNDEKQTKAERQGDTVASIVRSQSSEVARGESKAAKDETLLIDFSDDTPCDDFGAQQLLTEGSKNQQISILDMDNDFGLKEQQPRRSSDTKLDEIEGARLYHASWAGSWNTGTFDGSNTNIYSDYYCPQDAFESSTKPETDVSRTERYYSAVTQDCDTQVFR